MIGRLQITVLADNSVHAPDLIAEHGFSLLVEAGGRRILFDTGQGRALSENARALGLPLDGLDAVVISHGHYDHTGGLTAVLDAGNPPAVYLHPAALEAKYSRRKQPPHRYIGIPEAARRALNGSGARLAPTRSATTVAPGIWCTGQIRHPAPAAQPESGFFLDPGCTVPDPLADDQALVIETGRGIVVLAGCAHAGLIETLDHVARLSGRDEILAVIGGFHLFQGSAGAWEAAGDALERRQVEIIGPCHCTGLGAYAYLRGRFASRVWDGGCGARLVLESQPPGSPASGGAR